MRAAPCRPLRYRHGPYAGCHGPPVPDDVGADQARAGAPRGRRDARGAPAPGGGARPVWGARAAGETLEVRLPPGEAVDSVPRSAREAGHDVEIAGTTVTI